MALLIKDLKKLLNEFPEDAKVFYEDPNFGGEYEQILRKEDFNFDGGVLLISFPFESPVD